MGVVYHFVEQGSPEWQQGRDGMYTGSNAWRLLGDIFDPEWMKAQISNFSGNFYTKRGHLLEDEAIDLYEQITGDLIMRDENGVKVGFVTNSLYPGCLYSPDAVATPLIEVKCFTKDKHLKLIKGDIDWKILAQIYYGRVITGKKKAVLLPYNPHFAKKQIKNEFDELVDNPDYDPSLAFKIVPIPDRPAALKNIRQRLRRTFAHA